MQILVDQMQCLDIALNMCILRDTNTSFTNLKQLIEQQSKRQFTLRQFQQILKVAPFMYNHRWEIKHGKYELLISIPSNILDLL